MRKYILQYFNKRKVIDTKASRYINKIQKVPTRKLAA